MADKMADKMAISNKIELHNKTGFYEKKGAIFSNTNIIIFIFYMKYIITESQFNKTVFIYLDNQDFILIETIEDIYFLNSEEDKNAQIRYNKGRWCFITFELIDEISSFFSLILCSKSLICAKILSRS